MTLQSVRTPFSCKENPPKSLKDFGTARGEPS